jgi:DNA-binding CsgD family transcriptional regulator
VSATVLPAAHLDDVMSQHGLTAREAEVVDLLCAGLAVKEVARELVISVHTARDHVKAIHRKVDVRSRAELLVRLLGSQSHR